MSLRLASKLALIGFLLLLLLIPLSMLDALVAERQARGREVADEIAASSSHAQRLVGPLLRIESSYGLRRDRVVNDNGVLQQATEIIRERSLQLLPPTQLEIDAELGSERRSRGLFSALLYHSRQTLVGRFVMPALAVPAEAIEPRIERVDLVIGVGDTRGIRALSLTLNEVALSPQPGSRLPWLAEGVHGVVPAAAWSQSVLPFRIELELAGSASLGWLPLADANTVALRGDWPHPSFAGHYLPVDKGIDAQGFRARWQVSRLASRAQQALADCGGEARDCSGLLGNEFLLRLVEPVDRYLMTDRALKYGLLFLLLVFGAVFFIEVLKRVEVHPLQYALTGLASALFFLLLLSLAEHIGFAWAYALATMASVALTAYYLAAVLGGAARGWAFAGLLAALYGLLYGLLQSEDYALLMGALALFGLLATVMLLTRRLDWNLIGRRAASPAAPGSP